MQLFHGSSVPGIQTLEPRLSNHGKPYVYLTHTKALATIYAHNVMTPPNGWFTYYFRKEDGKLVYEEYFPNQLEEFYENQRGYIYTCEANLPVLEKMPWVYLSDEPVPVACCQEIPDLLSALLAYEKTGELIIRRFETLSARQLEVIHRINLSEIEKYHLREHPESEHGRFIFSHYPDLLQ